MLLIVARVGLIMLIQICEAPLQVSSDLPRNKTQAGTSIKQPSIFFLERDTAMKKYIVYISICKKTLSDSLQTLGLEVQAVVEAVALSCCQLMNQDVHHETHLFRNILNQLVLLFDFFTCSTCQQI